ncbi:DUF4373 domain-containing protein [Bacteroides thetaiotaomicron]|jgi:hypothetical protein|uniref:DUF4373 domain-containing protein n=1 Tax=Bacteroides thetaiotaomicron TaxID=818 RepID=A0A6I0N2N7_BACT4|nr:DUF4373 domain-containing protein [Bacteroides thetaiotaomicron]KAA3161907.1 DUF4373 domain-containing protein [Akkermansia sp. BIOML-A60]KAA3191798.1 DUF4373 domain-containing protein [Akkermansia sp. BIOML-A54]KAB4265634.1 DUF4373 domain-containing protein [Bacteroides thetaiotaomicron]KAB4267135.1 DUF4373 domain-containing protein [Bacteroides thetaiotaomicron]KAB4279542.1 DUF4373 domain-containing protein [Bacteroides thetaiotaomicron]
MARISKPGLDYFPLDVNFFQDRKVRRISNRHHAAGIAALTSLLCLIYKEKGFYVAWNQDTLFDISQEVCCEEEEMQAIIDDCLSVGLFDTYIYKEYGILTSQAIQEQYHKIITDSRRKYKLPLERFWLIKEEKDGTGNNSADIRSNINSKGTEVDEAENKIVDAGVNTTKTGVNITATEVTKTKPGIGTTGTNIHAAGTDIHAAGTGINATKTVTDGAAMKINAAKNREIAATIPQTKQETDTEIESKSETDTEIQSKPKREMENDIKPEREKDKERERQSKTENEWEKDREQPPVPSNGVSQAAPVAVKGLSLEISSGKREEENKEERRNGGIDQKGEARYNGTQYERNQLEEPKHNGTQYERNQQEEPKHNGTQYERNQQEEAPNESIASGGFSESLLRLNMDAIGIRNEQTVKGILALARRRKLGGPCGTLWKVLSSEYRSTLLKKNEPGDYILWALNHPAEFEDTYTGILKKRVRGR